MADDDDFLPPRDHNRPPDPLFLRTDELIANANRWLRERPVLRTDDEAGAAQDFQGQLRRLREALEEQQKAERKPHDDAVAEIRTRYRTPLELIGIALTKMSGLLTPFLQAKEDRLKREAERKQREADEAQAAAERALDKAAQSGTVEDELALQRAAEAAEDLRKAAVKGPGRAQVKGDYSARASSLTTYWSCEIEDEQKAFAHFAKNEEVANAVRVAILKIGNRLARQHKSAAAAPPGLRFVRREVAR
jgi:hypothetical protein